MGLGISAPARGGRRRGCSSEQLSKAANATRCYGDLYHGGRYTYGSEGEGKGEGGMRRCYLLLGTNSSSRRWQRRRLLLIVTGAETAELTTTGGSLAADWRVGGWVGEGCAVKKPSSDHVREPPWLTLCEQRERSTTLLFSLFGRKNLTMEGHNAVIQVGGMAVLSYPCATVLYVCQSGRWK
jgi:hypothetical protein